MASTSIKKLSGQLFGNRTSGPTVGLTRKQYMALAETSELDEYDRLKKKAVQALEAYERALHELDQFELDWKAECEAMGL